MTNFNEKANLPSRKNFLKDLGKTLVKMLKQLCSIAAVSSKVCKIHLSKVKQLLVFYHKLEHHQQFKKIW